MVFGGKEHRMHNQTPPSRRRPGSLRTSHGAGVHDETEVVPHVRVLDHRATKDRLIVSVSGMAPSNPRSPILHTRRAADGRIADLVASTRTLEEGTSWKEMVARLTGFLLVENRAESNDSSAGNEEDHSVRK
ncbi:predicted protein [Chaetomium globosum CBS 148.51]|uniref:Uncharacterized protein n=1 Tax=Chaetomium globosum (strain ATCC 6205 / CBS 148.51 / DSM 1962 / NBRC 6347 / NRRL 1970) TaxID=306901 RepID=Q2GU46_CHAGB|nr:uncharacterized protein CHGG_08508 [Chaetomium globosum CBS 148.51]EAQ84494.1 predicted protein [Chaetomium globosum CBS 148.51]